MRTAALVLACLMATAYVANATCGDSPKYTSSPPRVISVKQNPKNLNVPDLSYQVISFVNFEICCPP